MADKAPADAKADAKPAEASGGGGMKAMLPLILNLVLMPAVAFAMTQFVLLPKLNKGGAAAAEAHEGDGGDHGDDAHGGEDSHAKADSHGAEKKDAHGKDEKGHGAKPGKGGKYTAPMPSKILVNVSGTMGTRYLLANMTLVSKKANIKELVDEMDAQLRDVASSTLAGKSITDLEKAGARNLIRSELVAVFNSVLGEGAVQEIYLTEFAIQ
jgi:flagellar protein FliL